MYTLQRGMQNAADAAVLSAATNGTSSYAAEAQAIAAQMGYQNGVNNVVVTASNSASCPSGGDTCYSVTVSEVVPLYLVQVMGYSGNTTLNGSPALTVSATSLATQGTTTRNYCLLALGTSGDAILDNGVPAANFSGCDTMSNASAVCHGHNMGANYGDAHLSDSGCGMVQDSGLPIVADPYAALASSVPASNCALYPQEPGKKRHAPSTK